MTTVHILPQTSVELRRASSDLSAHAGAVWEWVARDDRARRLWELRLPTPAMIAVLEHLAQGGATAVTADVTVTIYPDPETEATVATWAGQQLARHADLAVRVPEHAVPPPVVAERPEVRYLA